MKMMMKKLMLTMLCLATYVAGHADVSGTVYFAINTDYTMKLWVKYGTYGGDPEDVIVMTKTDKKFNGKVIYSASFSKADKDGVGTICFQAFDGSTWKWSDFVINNTWTTDLTSVDGKLKEAEVAGMQTYKTDKTVLIHCKKDGTWTPTHAHNYYNNGSSDVSQGPWPGPSTTINATNSDWYDITISGRPCDYVIFNDGTDPGTQGTNKTTSLAIGDAAEYWVTGGAASTAVTTTIPEDFTSTYTRTVTNGSWGTICLPYFANVSGVDIYTIVYADEADTPGEIYLSEVNDHNMTKGHAYIFKATSSTLTATLTGELFTGETELSFYMKGNLGATIKAPVGSYVIQGDKIRKVVSGGDGVNVGQFRAYIDLTGISSWPGAPGLDLVPMSVYSDNTPTGMSDALHLDNSDETKDHTVYDLQGRKVAKAAANSSLFTLHSSLNPGLYIVNGKKVIMK